MQVRASEDIGSCGCGRSPTGMCIGWHALEESEFRERLAQYDSNQIKAFEQPKNNE